MWQLKLKFFSGIPTVTFTANKVRSAELSVGTHRADSILIAHDQGVLHTASVCHCHSTHICILIRLNDGPHGYFSNKKAEVSIGEKTYYTIIYKV